MKRNFDILGLGGGSQVPPRVGRDPPWEGGGGGLACGQGHLPHGKTATPSSYQTLGQGRHKYHLWVPRLPGSFLRTSAPPTNTARHRHLVPPPKIRLAEGISPCFTPKPKPRPLAQDPRQELNRSLVPLVTCITNDTIKPQPSDDGSLPRKPG